MMQLEHNFYSMTLLTSFFGHVPDVFFKCLKYCLLVLEVNKVCYWFLFLITSTQEEVSEEVIFETFRGDASRTLQLCSL